MVLAVERSILGVARHWLLTVNIMGGFFALAGVWAGFPILEQAFADMRRDLEARFARLAAREAAAQAT